VKRFNPQLTDKKIDFIPMEKGTKLVLVSIDYLPVMEVKYCKKDPKATFTDTIPVAEFVDVQGFKAKGKRISLGTVKSVKWLDPLPYEEPEEPDIEEDDDAETIQAGSLEEIEQAEAQEAFDNIDAETGSDDGSGFGGVGEQLELEL
jgi:topoisomerase-4 subunit A